MRTPWLLLVVAGCQALAEPAPRNLGEKVLQAHDRMHQRFDATRRMQLAIGVSDLERAQAEAKLVAELDEPDAAPEWRPYLDNIKRSAQQVRATKDLVAAAKTSALLGRECAKCHEAIKAKITFPKELAPTSQSPKLAVQMHAHQWAASRMWEGLIAPSDERWLQGAKGLAGARLDIAAEGGPGAPGIADEIGRVRSLAAQAQKPKSQQERAELYGDILGSCARCHYKIRDR